MGGKRARGAARKGEGQEGKPAGGVLRMSVGLSAGGAGSSSSSWSLLPWAAFLQVQCTIADVRHLGGGHASDNGTRGMQRAVTIRGCGIRAAAGRSSCSGGGHHLPSCCGLEPRAALGAVLWA